MAGGGVNTMSEKALYVLAGYDDDTEKLLSEIQNKSIIFFYRGC